MSYTEDQIKKFLEIFHNYNKKPIEEVNDRKRVKCWNCQNSERFFIHLGFKICDYCSASKKKSIYQRKYHYEKKVNQVSKRLNLTDEQRYELYNKLMKIDNHIMEILNRKYCRKRMISIFYLIKKLLEEMGCEKSKLVYLKISSQTLENYEKW